MKFIPLAGAMIIGLLMTTAFVFLQDNRKELHNSIDNYLNRLYFRMNASDIGYDIREENNGQGESSQGARQFVHNIQQFKMEDIVRYFDLLSLKRNRRPMQIAFIGDSTVRQHFVSFIRWIPDYDRKIVPVSISNTVEDLFHEDVNVTSHLLDLRVSFYWRNLIKSELIADFKRWSSTGDDTQAPDFILIGITVHHLVVNNMSVSLFKYEKLVEDELVPLMKESLAVHPFQQIIWLRQSLTTLYELFYVDINPDKIKKYNDILIRIFKGTNVLMWDNINAIVDEYNRACSLTRYDRQDLHEYENCFDNFHPGYGVLSLGTRLFINHIFDSL